MLLDRYRVPGGGGAIDYQRFCDQCNKVRQAGMAGVVGVPCLYGPFVRSFGITSPSSGGRTLHDIQRRENGRAPRFDERLTAHFPESVTGRGLLPPALLGAYLGRFWATQLVLNVVHKRPSSTMFLSFHDTGNA